MKFSVAQFAAHLNPPLSRMRVNQLVTAGHLHRDKTGKIDLEHPVNATWVAARTQTVAMHKVGGRRPASGGPPTPAVRAPAPGFVIASQIDGDEIIDTLSRIMAATDIRGVAMADVTKLHKIEATLKARVEREHKRRELIERTLVRTVFGRIYQVEGSELKTLGSKLAPDLAGIFGIDDPVMVQHVEQRIDGEVLKSLAHIKRVINDMLTNADAMVMEV